MAVVPLITLLDISSQQWLLGINNSALITTTPVSGYSVVNSILLNDTSVNQTWRLTVLTTGLLKLTAAPSSSAPTQVLCYSPDGALYAIQISNGQLQTTIGSLCNIQLSDMDAALADRLYDSTGQFWPQAERILYIQEAFRTWNALTSYWRGDFIMQTTQGSAFYDITDQMVAPNTLRPHTLTNSDIASIIEYHLLEPVVGIGTWTGSLQFNISDILAAIARRRDDILGVSGCSITHRTVLAASERTYLLPTEIDLRRVAFVPEAGLGIVTSVLWQDDTWGVQAFDPAYTTTPAGIPSIYIVSTQPLLAFDTDIPPLPGQFDLLTIESGAAPSLAPEPFTFAIPDDWLWVLKWGALADLLSRESNAKDLPRAAYCEQRYRQGIELLSAAPALLAARVNNVPLQMDSVTSADQYDTTWQGQAQGPPQAGLTAGLNLIAIAPTPDAGPYSLTLTVVENAPVPVNETDCLSITQDIYEALLGYAQHLAAFKMGGEEFAATDPLYKNFLHLAALYSSRLAEQGEFTSVLYAISQRDAETNPRYSLKADPSDEGDQ